MAGIFQFDTRQLRDMAGRFAAAESEWNRVAESELHAYKRKVQSALQREAPGKRLPHRIEARVERTGPTMLELTFTAEGVSNDILRYIIFGTRPHHIEAVRAKALRFYWKKVRSIVFFRSVWHPGTRPNPFHRRALISTRGDLRALEKRIGQHTLELFR